MRTSNKRSTLQNPMLYRRFVTYVAKMNPRLEIDPDVIDESLEWDEALNALARIYPDLKTAPGDDFPEIKQLRGFLSDEYGIDNKHVQNLIIADDDVFNEQELGEVSYAISGRSPHAMKLDKLKKAPSTRDVRQYARRPNRLDLIGLDNPGARD